MDIGATERRQTGRRSGLKPGCKVGTSLQARTKRPPLEAVKRRDIRSILCRRQDCDPAELAESAVFEMVHSSPWRTPWRLDRGSNK